MAQKVGKPLMSWGPTSNGSQYPFDDWLNGEVWILTRGEDFKVRPTSFSGTIRSAAQRRNGRCHTKVMDEKRIQVQGYDFPE